MLRAFLKDSAIYGVAGVLARAISLLLLPFYTRVLSPEQYGVVDLLMVFGALVNVSVALEIAQGLARYMPEAQSDDERASWVSTALWFTAGAFLVFGALCVAFARPFARLLLESSDLWQLFLLGAASASINAIYYLGQTQLRWMRMASRSAIANLVFTLTAIAATIYFVLVLRLGIRGVLYGQLTGFTVGTVMTIVFARANYRLTFSMDKCREMLRFSLPFVPSSIALFAATYVDRFAIKELLTLQDVGIYGVAYRLASPMLLMMAAFQASLTPLVITHYKEEQTREQLARIFRYFVAGAVVVSLLMSVFAREIVTVFVAAEYAAAATLVPLLAPAVLLPQMNVFAPGLFIAKKTAPVALLAVYSAFVAILLNLLLVPRLGILGSALGNFVANASAFAIFMSMSQRHYHVPHHWRSIAGGVATAAAIVLTAFVIPAGPRMVFAHAALGLLGALAVPFVVLGRDEIRLLGRKSLAILART